MKFNELKKRMKKQYYEIVGNHSAVQICRWTKRSLRDEEVCYKQKFYGIKSHLCCQMTPWLGCQNKCIHCWRPIEFNFELEGKINSPSEIIDKCILAQQKLLKGFNIDVNSKKEQLSKANQEKYKEAQEPMQFAISLSGEPTIYSQIGDLIEELTKRGKTSFLVTNGLYPEKIKELAENNQLPTQLYVSVNASNEKLYNEFHRSSVKDAWKKLNQTLEIFSRFTPRTTPKGVPRDISKEISTRSIFRMNLVRNLNMNDEHIEEYAEMIKKANPLFVEVKGFMSVGFARERLGYDRMPTDKEMKKFCEKLANTTGLKILDSHERSRAYVLGKNKEELKI